MLKEFQKFIMRGNVLDLAIGVIIGTAFGAIVTSLVNDIIMPPIGLIIGGIDFSSIVLTLKAAEGETPAVTMNIGVFINTLINFLIIAFVIFLLVRAVNNMMERMAKKEEAKPAAPAGPTTEEKLVAAIEKLNANLEKMSK
ncbi:MAG: large-conductance mechanosensitive channel protein MscL [Anaerolineae bacterium]